MQNKVLIISQIKQTSSSLVKTKISSKKASETAQWQCTGLIYS